MIHKTIPISFEHRIFFTRNAFQVENTHLKDLLTEDIEERGTVAILFFLDAGVAAGNPKLAPQIAAYFQGFESEIRLTAAPIILPGGESCKNTFQHVEAVWSAINEHNICRHSYVIALGGGAFLDMVGFAASTAHRGVRHIRMPSTSLSQGDGGVGVKNGVNYFGKKNWVGAFTVPHAVINDFALLDTLPIKERRAGIIEAIKVALIRDAAFFHEMEEKSHSLAELNPEALEYIIQRSAELHIAHIATSGDPFEHGSTRPLDFGHWAAHKLEQLSQFRVGHGEAVAIGISLDLLYSVEIGILEASIAQRILNLISAIGFDHYSAELDGENDAGKWIILEGLEEFREHLGGELTITLVPKIGQKIEVHTMDEAAILRALTRLRESSQKAPLT